MSDISAIQTVNICYEYGKNQKIFDDYSFSVKRGTLTALTGKSGAGKSTLLYILSGMLRPKSGIVEVLGEKLYEMSDSERSIFRAKTAGFVFQNFALDMRKTIEDNVLETCIYAGVEQKNIEIMLMKFLVA
ncbi:MAG: ATP-binding cassette domain-containing protein [Actinomycetaceae bacterium]|nr:ATP-binding cassette domain-containing protein [Actinomycetaceae bacterium]